MDIPSIELTAHRFWPLDNRTRKQQKNVTRMNWMYRPTNLLYQQSRVWENKNVGKLGNGNLFYI